MKFTTWLENRANQKKCPKCGSTHVIYSREDNGKPEYKCINCGAYFTVSSNAPNNHLFTYPSY